MSSPDSNPPSLIPPAVTAARSSDTFRAKSIATRLTEAEFAEVEEAAARDGKKVGEWLRDAALAEARGEEKGNTDPILLAELMGIRALILNLFREGRGTQLATKLCARFPRIPTRSSSRRLTNSSRNCG